MNNVRLEGILVVLTTPLNADETVDVDAYRRQIARCLAAGVHGVVALGSAGEFAALSDAAKRKAIATAVDEVDGRVPVVAGTGEPSTRLAVESTRVARDLGADAALVVPPYYYPMSDEAVLRHYRTVAAEGGLPVMLYNIPAFTKVTVDPDVVRALAPEPGIIGLKDSSRDLTYYRSLAETVRSDTFTIVTGSDGLLMYSLLAGGDGAISPGTNVAPGWFVELWDAFQDGRWDDAWECQQRIITMHRQIGYGAFPAGIKGALSSLGIGSGRLAAPNVGVSDEQLASIRDWLIENDLI